MITVHHLNDSRSQRILWLLEELDLDYVVKRYQRDPATMLAPPELKAVHPLGKSPVIDDGEVRVAETGAIIEHLLDTHGNGRLRPPPRRPVAHAARPLARRCPRRARRPWRRGGRRRARAGARTMPTRPRIMCIQIDS